MARPLPLLASFLLTGLASAQQWCAPGAEWLFGFSSQQATGVRHAWYSGDTVVGGLAAKRIDQFIYAYDPVFPFGSAFSAAAAPIFTTEVGDQVWIWNNGSSSYDTLLWFGAVPGDHWDIPHYPGPGRFDVLDTGTTVVDGIPLHYLVVEEPIIMGNTDTLRERLGFDFFYIDPIETLLLDYTTAWLQCYRDDSIAQFNGYMVSEPCDFTLVIADPEHTSWSVYPDPGTDHFTLEVPSEAQACEVALFDAQGRIVLRHDLSRGHTRIGCEGLAQGLFTYRVVDRDGNVLANGRWVKRY
jgi:hypothetical protein